MLIHVQVSENSTFPLLLLGTQNSVVFVGHADDFTFCSCTVLNVQGFLEN